MANIPFLGAETSVNDTPYLGSPADIANLDGVERKSDKGVANGYAPLDGSGKVPQGNLPDTASLDAEVDGKITTHNSATTSVHGIADTTNLVLTNDSRISGIAGLSINTSGGGTINTSNGGGSINTTGGDEGVGGSINTSGGSEGAGGSINTSDGGGSINTSGGWAGSGGSINTSAGDSDGGGNINTAGAEFGRGGSINLSNNGGSIIANGGDGNSGGSLNMSANDDFAGGSINTSAGWDAGGGSINTSNGGGSIDTQGVYIGSGAFGFNNTAKLRKGTTDAGDGGYKGIALECSAQYELKWEAGRLYTLQQNGTTIRSVEHCMSAPTAQDDSTRGFVVGSRWIMDSGKTYACTDNEYDEAVWELKFSQENGNDGGSGGTIDLSGSLGNGGSIDLSGGETGEVGGSIISTGGSAGGAGGTLNMSGVDGQNGGSISTYATSFGAGGSIDTTDVGGSIDTHGYGGSINTSISGGSINTNGSEGGANAGGSINTSGGGDGAGGSINTSNGGGSINTSNSGGSINTAGGDAGGGGSINLSNGGGSITSVGEYDVSGGSINLSYALVDGDKYSGGSIDTSGGGSINTQNLGGSINTSNGGGSINTSGGGGSILTSGMSSANYSSIGGKIDLRALMDETSNGGSIISTGNNGYNGGTLNMSAGGTNNGGSIDTRGGGYGAGGSINTSNRGGSINTSGSVSAIGGSINTSGGGSINLSDGGGSINTSGEGGSIDTRGTGSIQLGVPQTRTTLVGSATSSSDNPTITLPNASGTVALTSDNRFTDSRTPTAHTHAISDVTSLQTALDGKQASGSYVLTTDARLGSQTIFTLGGEAKTTFALGTSYLYGCMPTRGPMVSGSYLNAVLRILGNFTVTGISVHQYLPSTTTATLTYQLMRITIGGSAITPLGSSIVVAGNNNLTTSASSISASLNSGDEIGLMLTLGATGTVPVATAATTILANIYCVPR